MKLVAAAAVLTTLILACGGSGGDGNEPSASAPTSSATEIPTPPTPQPTAAPTLAPTVSPALAGVAVTFKNGDLQLGGLLWKPAGNGPFPAVLWNHGSEKLPGAPQANPLLGPVFVARGYVYFVPFRRGQGTSQGAYISDETDKVTGIARAELVTRLHQTEQLSDQQAGLAHLKSLPYVDKQKIVVGGWSYGGIQTLLGGAVAANGYRAAVAFTPAAQSWAGNTSLQTALLAAGNAAALPVMLIQAQNDFDLTPTDAIQKSMLAAGKSVERKVYPAFGTTEQEAHEFAVKGSAIWGPDVFAFLEKALK